MSLKAARKLSNLSYLIKQISKIEFFVEQVTSNYFTDSLGPNFLLEALSIFELGLLFYKLKKYFASKSQLYTTGNPVDVKLLEQEERIKGLFSYRDTKVCVTPEEEQELKKKIKATLEKMREAKTLSHFNQGFQEQPKRNQKMQALLSKLPMDVKEETELVDKFFAPIRLAEILNITRPYIYCFAQIYYNQMSWKPYFISLFIDILRLVLQSCIKFTNSAELQEFRRRNKDLIMNYVLRNPFYAEILRKRMIDPLLDRLFPKLPIVKKIIIYAIEIRSSLSFLM